MIAIDTNVLVRFLTGDDARQAARARRLFERAVGSSTSIFVSDIVLCEVVWVMSFSYKVGRRDVASSLRQLLHARHMTFFAPDALARALDRFVAGRGDFSDYLVAEHARAAGCSAVATFDKALLGETGFVEP